MMAEELSKELTELARERDKLALELKELEERFEALRDKNAKWNISDQIALMTK